VEVFCGIPGTIVPSWRQETGELRSSSAFGRREGLCSLVNGAPWAGTKSVALNPSFREWDIVDPSLRVVGVQYLLSSWRVGASVSAAVGSGCGEVRVLGAGGR